jgi:hypothetical protein
VALSQSFLYLSKINGKFEKRYYATDTIKFKLEGAFQSTRGSIQSFTDSSFYIHDTEILLKDIEYIDIDRGFIGAKLIVAGIALPLIDIINQSYPPDARILYISGGLIVSAFIIRLFQSKNFIPGKNHKLDIILDD